MQNGIRVITAMNRKGGCGKTTLIMGLASAAAERGESVTIFDTDESRSSWKWMERAKAQGHWNDLVRVIPTLSAAAVIAEITAIFAQPDQEHLILVDTFGGGSEAQDHLALISHLLIAPCMLSANNYEESLETGLWYIRLKSRVEDPGELPPFRVLLNRVPLSRSAAEHEIYEQVIRNMPVLGEVVMNRAMYTRLDGQGLLGEIRRSTRNPGVANHLATALQEMDEVLTELDRTIREEG
ncbi:AAA family ATPase [Paracoccus sp. MBLB3053]|uniref:AAA family ATPase n=1 Tax=Paracoccus aurantius TaxID=3073814 RepID=A0ABU2I142_9RHOB|nr:AAA family ATPase [Paracoccus sp. MBLB3053]MDS9470269.1 AAA family ATPase [Paracoccus sp. MBLB3053]